MLSVIYAECRKETHFAECHYAENHYVECHYAMCHCAVAKQFKMSLFVASTILDILDK